MAQEACLCPKAEGRIARHGKEADLGAAGRLGRSYERRDGAFELPEGTPWEATAAGAFRSPDKEPSGEPRSPSTTTSPGSVRYTSGHNHSFECKAVDQEPREAPRARSLVGEAHGRMGTIGHGLPLAAGQVWRVTKKMKKKPKSRTLRHQPWRERNQSSAPRARPRKDLGDVE